MVLIDADIVTPYFRVGDHRDVLQREGISIIAAPGALASFELPAVPPELRQALAPSEQHVVMDVGGDPEGGRFLAGFAEEITARGYDMWFVANPNRPATPDAKNSSMRPGRLRSRRASASPASSPIHTSARSRRPRAFCMD